MGSFFVTATAFGALSLYGYTTKSNLSAGSCACSARYKSRACVRVPTIHSTYRVGADPRLVCSPVIGSSDFLTVTRRIVW